VALWNEFKLNNNRIDIEESYEHFLHLWFQHLSFLGSWWCRLFPFQTLPFAFKIILKAPCFASSDSFCQNIVIWLERSERTLTCFFRNRSLIFSTRHRNTRVLSAPQLQRNCR
jgi:hypothetical protein